MPYSAKMVNNVIMAMSQQGKLSRICGVFGNIFLNQSIIIFLFPSDMTDHIPEASPLPETTPPPGVLISTSGIQ